jgi:hypothetical protein
MNQSNSFRDSSRRLRLWGSLLALGALPWLTGCVVVAAGAVGAGAVAYVRGELDSSVEHGIDDTYRATQQALAALEFAKISEHKSMIDAELVSRTALDKKVEIKLSKITERMTKIQIRVGMVGDQQLSLAILEKIQAQLR